MTLPLKKALQPAHPSEKPRNCAISPPSCQRGVPVYPLRYGIADKGFEAAVFPTLSVKGYPELKGSKAYGLRVLRPGTYVYLFYYQNSRMWTQHYQVTSDVRFAPIWWTEADCQDAAPGRLARPDTTGAKPYLLAPEDKIADTVYVLATDTILTHATLWRIETNDGGLRDKLATKIKPAGGATQTHAFNAVLLGTATRELMPATYGQAMYYPWSEIQPSPPGPDFNRIISDMYITLSPRKEVVPLGVALQDPVGMVGELHYLAASEVKRKTRYAGENAHKLQSGRFIAGYFQAAKNSPRASSPELAKALAKQRNLIDYTNAVAFPDRYEKRIVAFDTAIDMAVRDVSSWVDLIEAPGLLGKALSCFDLKILHNARDYEKAVFNCIGSLVHTQDGQRALAKLTSIPPAQSPYWLALANGSQILMARLQEKTADIAKNMFDVVDKYMEEHAATPTTNALIGLLQALPQNKQADILVRRLRHVIEIRFNATIVQYDLSLADMWRFAYEFQGYQTLGSERLRGWKRPMPKVTQAEATARILVYDWVKIGETTYRELDSAPIERLALPPTRPIKVEGNIFINTLKRMRTPGGYLFTGLGGWLAYKGMVEAGKQFNSTELQVSNAVSVIGAFSALIAAGIEIVATVVAVRAGARGNVALATTAKIFATKRGVAIFGAGGAGIATAADAIRAVNALNESNSEQARMYLGSAIAGGVMTLAAWGGGTATAATISGGGAAVAVLGLTPAGWAVVGLVALGVGIAFNVGVDMTKHGPVEIWLKHSAWGVDRRHYTRSEELDAIHGLYYRPRLSAEWDKTSGYEIGTLRIHCQLPGTNDMPAEHFQTQLSFTLAGNELVPVQGPIVYAAGTSPIDYRRQCLITPLGHTGKECGWAIQMHEDTKVALKYLYLPAPVEQPGLAIDQPGAPTPLVFSSGGLFTDPIDPAKLEPVGTPL
ncbi:toxin VasX [Cupriavidus sp. 2TAF22]|uniref:toxin VasX n=1 Tax=unclassified Cupriavidus TaxID=2640874 RepID=UPI003F9312BE